ncbi:MAG TPA: hypothetical protein VFT82_04500 [Candidatus Paceibacterota bacterium]|nr:hypothetical protein [Candidatus Paceibacterota bacterium]
MFESENKSGLDRLKKSLYSRNVGESEAPRHSIHGEEVTVPESWDEPGEAGGENAPKLSPERRYAYKIVFICSALFLLAAFAIAAYTFLSGGNFVSVDNVDILIEGPATIAGGDTLSLDVTVANKNQTGIQLVDLVAEYPQGTKDPLDPSKDLTQERISLGDINSQSVAQKNLSAILFGQEGDVKDIKFTAEYRTADSNAIFFKEKVYHVTISSSPVIVSVDSLDKVQGGEPFDMTVTVTSNTTDTVKNLLLSLDYPFGFSVVSSDPAATYGDNVWDIGDLAPGAKRIIKLRATATGDDGEDKTMHANVGIQSSQNEREIATTIITQDHTFTIEKPFLGIDLTLDGSHSDLAAAAGHIVHGDILWSNNSASQITNARIVATLSGNVLDRNSVTVEDGGYYDSLSNSIIWDSGRATSLATIAPGANGRVSFTLSSSPLSPGQAVSNPQITIAVSASGDRTDESGAPQSVNTAVTRSVKLASNLALSSRAVYSQGPFKNTGPMPPKVDQATTYTVIWTVTNTSNTVTGAKVTANLPPYVKWTGAVDPSDASISYDPKSGSVEWDVGDVPANADIGSGAKQVSFQISFTPSANQAGGSPDLVSDAAITGTDVFTGAVLQNSAPGLSTRITTDLLFSNGDEIVQQ